MEAPSTFMLAVLHGLQGKSVYQGSVPDDVKALRRKANRAAARSRRINRRSK